MDDSNGSQTSGAQADVYACSADSTDLDWTLIPLSGPGYPNYGQTFMLYSMVLAPGCVAYCSCLDDWLGWETDGSAIAMYHNSVPTCDSSDSHEKWSMWTSNGGATEYLAPADIDPTQLQIPVVSPAGSSPGNYALLNMWHSGANNDQQVTLSLPVNPNDGP
jgi:hypothetical protein